MDNNYNLDKEITNTTLFINVEDFSLTNTNNIKFSVPILFQDSSSDINEIKTKTNISHVLNKTDYTQETITECNYIICNIPHSVAKECPHDVNKIVKKGQKFIGCFLNGDISLPKIIQRSC